MRLQTRVLICELATIKPESQGEEQAYAHCKIDHRAGDTSRTIA